MEFNIEGDGLNSIFPSTALIAPDGKMEFNIEGDGLKHRKEDGCNGG